MADLDKERDWGAVGSIVLEKVREWHTRAIRMYVIGYPLMMITFILLVAVEVLLNHFDATRELNFMVALVALVAFFFFQFHPNAVLAMFGVGIPSGFPHDLKVFEELIKEFNFPNLELRQLVTEGWNSLKQLLRLGTHGALFFVVVSTVLGTWQVSKMGAVLPVFVILAGVAMWSILFAPPESKWYRKITLGILLVAAGIFLYHGFFGEEKKPKGKGSGGGTSQTAAQGAASSALAATGSIKLLVKSAKKEVTNLFTDEWRVVGSVDCEVAATPGGWCGAGVQPAGTYRVIVKYDRVGLQQEDGKVHQIPPRGVHLLDLWGNSPEFVAVFQKNAPLKNLRIAGVVVRSAEGNIFDPTTAEQGRFEQEVAGPVEFTVNLPQNEPFYRQVKGSIKVDLEKLVE